MFNKAGLVLLVATTALFSSVTSARAQQTLNFTFGYFTVHGEDARPSCSPAASTDCDVLVKDRQFLSFDINDFSGATVGGEWLVPFGNFLEGGAGISFSRRTVPSVYTNFVDTDGTEVDQDLRLRLVPIDFTVRLIPTGQSSPVQPYFGVGVGIVNWRYSESGEFINFSGGQRTIFRDTFVGTGNATGPVVLGGLRFVGDHATGGFEIRYRKAEDTLPEGEFAASKIDLGGWSYLVTGGVRFGR
jgi:type 1 fimbria pilin